MRTCKLLMKVLKLFAPLIVGANAQVFVPEGSTLDSGTPYCATEVGGDLVPF